jgi:hypothetical protein
VNEIQHFSFGTVASPIAPEAGTFTLSFGGQTTSTLNWDDDETTIQAALEALASIGAGNVSVSSDFNSGFNVEFLGDLADFNLPQLTANSSLKQPADTVSVTETQAGETGVSTQIFTVELSDAPTEGNFILNEGGFGDTDPIAYNASAATLEAAIDALVGYAVTGSAGGPWTCESDAQEAYSWSGAEDPSAPLRKAVGIEVATDQDGDNNWEGSGGVEFPVSGLAGSGTISSTGTGSIALPVSGLAGTGTTPYEGACAVAFAVSALSGSGTVPYTGTGDVALSVSSLAGTGTISSTGTGAEALPVSTLAGTGTLTVNATGGVAFAFALGGGAELADTGKGFKHYEEFSNIERFLNLA